ncbi:valine--tRNA ligase [Silanimonas sp.]|uniref:valine--tRNA ligase n=1 Tax=Silanimonas sp. TaxID=1929290 RepID=UPI001BBC13E6|nr:valine--tRNA ligase [Silanimonas sp.]MBS3897172.1 valine--tRNA ligase [Silanimonas sp.]MBS3923875.1 valine--tRNA ligase [Xanthomonadaceae bacterium]
MDKSFEPATFESRWYAHWESQGLFKPSGDTTKPAYSILLPPPNVTGTLHMGHAFQHTLMDTLIRYHRMRGFDTLWQLGTDHAGIATEMVVSRNLHLAGEGETRDSLGRETFVEKVWAWKQESGDTIERQMRRMGSSGDWSRSVFTMDPMPSKAVVETFIRLHEQGLIYRGQKLVNWDPVLKTAISDLEVVSEEEIGQLWSIRYPLVDANYEHVETDADGVETLRETRDYLVVATTRPETMLGDVAVMVHPEDERYAHLVGKQVRLPLCERTIPIIADDYVDRAFGTGVVKVTPAHDFNDYAVGQRHGLPMINILTPSARIIGGDEDSAYQTVSQTAYEAVSAGIRMADVLRHIPARYRGMDRFDARKVIVEDLEALSLLVEAKPHKLMVPRGDRTGQVIEPYLTDQWFVKMDEFAKKGLEAVESGRVRFVPENWINTYRHWLENIQDWCISRQLWWGHRIPAWYDDSGKVYVGRDEAEVRATHGLGSHVALRQDSDVLETWFSSAIWPHSTLGWPDAQAMAERGFDRYLPSSVLVTGFDIIFFWVARMIMMTEHFTGEVPFKDVYITGLVRDKDGQKMSKSKGNVLDPIDLIDGISIEALIAKRTSGLLKPTDAPKIEKATRKEFPEGIPAFGTDALRFTFASLATHGRDIKFDLARCEGYKNFCNKLWNAARFVLMNTEGFSASGVPTPTTDAERWILDRLQQLLKEVETQFAAYRFDLAAQAMYEFVWNGVCDWFLELSKPALQGDDAAAIASTRHTLLYVLEQSLRVLHPLIPFVTEEIWSHLAPKLGLADTASLDGAAAAATASISVQAYPAFDATLTNARAATDIEWLKSAITALRSIRSQLGVPPGKAVPLLVHASATAAPTDRARIDRHAAGLKFLAKLESIDWLQGEPPAAAAAVLGELTLLVPLAGLVDLEAERTRLDREIQRVAGEIAKCKAKLDSSTFVANAPAAVVEQERRRLAEWTTTQEGLEANRRRL